MCPTMPGAVPACDAPGGSFPAARASPVTPGTPGVPPDDSGRPASPRSVSRRRAHIPIPGVTASCTCARIHESPPEARPQEVLLFTLERQRYGLPVEDVRELVRAARLTHLPQAPDVVEGLLNLRGELLPVLDLRRRFRHPARPLSPMDHFIVARAGPRRWRCAWTAPRACTPLPRGVGRPPASCPAWGSWPAPRS